MAVNVYALDPAHDSHHARETAKEAMQFAQQSLGGEWKLVSSSAKMRKALFEADFNGRRVIGKVSPSERAHNAYASLQKLWIAGLQPPARFTVPEPIAWFPERSLLIQEKAPGHSMADVMQHKSNDTGFARDAAAWLKAVWELEVDGTPAGLDGEDVVKRSRDVSLALGNSRADNLSQAVLQVLAADSPDLRPSHGDFHPLNVFVSPERVTAIDLDTFGLREREVDVAYFLAQTAIFGIHLHESFAATQELRAEFLSECCTVNKQRVVAYMAWTFLQSLHYDLCILRIENESAELMLGAADRLLTTGSTELT
jgi:hypothetical protein